MFTSKLVVQLNETQDSEMTREERFDYDYVEERQNEQNIWVKRLRSDVREYLEYYLNVNVVSINVDNTNHRIMITRSGKFTMRQIENCMKNNPFGIEFDERDFCILILQL